MKKHFILSFILLLVLLTFSIPGKTQQYAYYDTNHGLSSSRINSIFQDSEGFMWIATEDGLNRFDGNKFVVYRHIPNDTTSIANNYVRSIFEDSKHRFWVTTGAGLSLYDKTTDQFCPYTVLSYDKKKEISQFFYLTEDRAGNLWASSSGNGVVRMNMETGENLYFNTKNSGICSDHVNVIYEDRFGNIWFGSGQDGTCIYNPTNGTFRTHNHLQEDMKSITSDAVSSICEDMKGNVWIGTLTGGVNIFSFSNQSYSPLKTPDSKSNNEIGCLLKDSQENIWIGKMGNGFDVYSVIDNKFHDINISTPLVNIAESKVQAIYEDKQGNIWMGLFEKGLFMIPKEKSFFTNYTFNPFHVDTSIEEGAVQAVFSDSHSELWFSVGGIGVYRLDKDRNIAKHYKANNENALLSNIVLTIYEDSQQDIWMGTYLNGAVRYNRNTNSFDLNLNKGNPPYGLLSTHVTGFMEDTDGRLWIITNGGGINIYDPQTKTFEYITHDDKSPDKNQLIDNWCNALIKDKSGLYWIGTYRGLCTYDRVNRKFEYYTTENKKISNDIILSLKEDSKGNMWIGTNDGLVCIHTQTGKIQTYNTKDGLPNSLINGIDEDSEGNIWISTNYGLSMYDTSNSKFTNYTTADGLLTNELNRYAFFKSKNGEFIVGSMKGLTTFFANDRIYGQAKPLSLMFTDLYIFNERVKVNAEVNNALTKTINYTDEVVFNHEQNSFSIEFSALEYVYPNKVYYEVMMKGFDQDWHTSKSKMVTYTNLSPGNYTLIVRAWTNNKEHYLEKELNIKLLPPFWATFWAKLLYILISLAIAYFIYRYTNDRIKVRRQEQLTQAKLQFFTDISHEIRTPLTLILSPLSKLISNNKDTSLLQTYNTMYKNGVRLLQLVNQIMDLRALEFGKKKLMVSETDITAFVRELKNSFNILAEEKNLSYTFSSDPENITGYMDSDILAKILFNLISNAFKYTEQGDIAVHIQAEDGKQENCLVITVTDTGRGVPKDQQQMIFERFYRANPAKNEKGNSSGIGLHLTKKLVELHRGKISFTSEPDKGSCFSVSIPYQKRSFAANEISENKEQVDITGAKEFLAVKEKEKQTNQPALSSQYHKTILIVEDNMDIRNLLTSELNYRYHILEASNGKEALRITMEKKPDLIISDIMMPEMDGIEFCTKIRNNPDICLIPFIILTAKSSVKQQTEGIEHGADAYIVKPFDINYLKATISQLLKSHEKMLSNKIQKEEALPVIESTDDKLLKKLKDLIDLRLDNPELSVDMLCKELGLSRTHLNRKVRELTGDSPASYIRQLRLQKAVLLLKTGNFTIAEIAFMTGFSSPSYFSQAFRDYYGVTPKEYAGNERNG